jgi:hypothetical protein
LAPVAAVLAALSLFVASPATAAAWHHHKLAPSKPTQPAQLAPATVTKAEASRLKGTDVFAAACPVPGQRVTTPTSPQVYLIDPDFFINLIPNPTVYFNLWDSWSGIATFDDATLIDCFPEGYFTMNNAHLAKTVSDPAVYIYDEPGGGYRWITSAAVFNMYAFSWSKIRAQASVSPISSLTWHG